MYNEKSGTQQEKMLLVANRYFDVKPHLYIWARSGADALDSNVQVLRDRIMSDIMMDRYSYAAVSDKARQ